MDFDWKELIKLAAPAAGMFAGSPAAQAAFARTWHQQDQQAQAERARKAIQEQQQQRLGADYLLKIGDHAQQFDDPVALDQFLGLAEDAGAQAGYVKAGDLRGRFTVSESKIAAKQLKSLTEQLDRLENSGYDLYELANSGQHVSVNGQSMPIASALQITHRLPTTPTGELVPKPKKPVAKTGTIDERAAGLLEEIATATEAGDTATATTKQAEYNNLLKAKSELTAAGRAPVDPQLKAIRDLDEQLKRKQLAKPDASPADSGPEASRRFSMEERLAKTWSDATKSQREMQRQFSLMQTGLKRFREGDKNGGSQAVLVTFQKILDPTSVVRESEYARSAAGISALGRLEGYFDKLRAGGAGVPDAELAGMVKTAQSMLNEMGQYSAGTRNRINAKIKQYKLNPDAIFDDTLMSDVGPQQPDSAPNPKASAAAKLGQRK